MEIQVRTASASEASIVAEILLEAVEWMESSGNSLWQPSDVSLGMIADDVASGRFVLACVAGNPVGTMKHQDLDEVHWPDALPEEAVYVHKVAVRRGVAGGKVSNALLNWAVTYTSAQGRPFLRLDCDSGRPKLRAVYERFGFIHHSDWQVGEFNISRYQFQCPPVVSGKPLFTTRPAVAADIDPMMKLAHEGIRPHFEKLWEWDQEENEAKFRQKFELSEVSIILVDGKEVGYFKLEDRGDHAYLDAIYIGKQYRSDGLGKKVVESLIKRTHSNRKPLRLRVISSNPAQNLYRRLGFKVTASNATHIYMEVGGDVA